MAIFGKRGKQLVVKQDQFDQIDQERRNEARVRLIAHITTNFPNESKRLSKEELQFFAEEGTRKAEGYGLKAEYEIQFYFNFMLTLGVNFENSEKYADIGAELKNLDKPAGERLAKLVEMVQSATAKH